MIGKSLVLVLLDCIINVYFDFSKIQQYSPSEPAKVYEKTASRRSNAIFNPKGTINKLKQGDPPEYLDEEGRKDLIRQYLDVGDFTISFCDINFDKFQK